MRRRGVFNKFKKILVVMIISITMFLAMPVKSEAGLIGDALNLIVRAPDGVMDVIDNIMAGSEEYTSIKLNLDGDEDDKVDEDAEVWYKVVQTFNKGLGGTTQGRIYNFIVTPYEIFSSGKYDENNYTKIGWLDVNFFSDKTITSNTGISSDILAPVISNIYKSLRDLCMILMLLVILYIGIKIMISSIAEQQAKYKRFLTDWVVGFALLFAMHYIMCGIMAINSVVVDLLSSDEGDSYYVGVRELEETSWYDVATSHDQDFMFAASEYDNFKANRLCVKKEGTFNDEVTNTEKVGRIQLKAGEAICSRTDMMREQAIDLKKWGDKEGIQLSASISNGQDGDRTLDNKAILKLNAMSYLRTISHFSLQDENKVTFYTGGKTKNATESTTMGYTVLYFGLVIQTVMFLFTYAKRVLQMAFLTMIAPIVAIMYPVDKLGDSKAQSFNTWFKDYLFNMLIQPMHLLLYMIFMVAAGELVSKNIIYALVVYAFMIPAEKYFKKMLGFEKASNGAGGPLKDAIGHGLAMDALGKLAGIGPASHGGGKGGSSSPSRIKPRLDKLKAKGNTNPASSGIDNVSNLPDPQNQSNSNNLNNPNSPNNTNNQKTRNNQNSRNNPPAGGGFDKVKAAVNKIPVLGAGLRTLGAGARTVGKRTIRGVTGNRMSSIQKGFGKAVGRTVLEGAGNVARFTGKTLLRGGAAIGAGAIGTMVGAATAVATGDINSLWKGASVGISAGNKIGGNVADSFDNFVGNFASEVQAERAATDKDYRADLRRDQAREKLQDYLSTLSSEDYKKASHIIDSMAPYVSISDEKDMEALKKIMYDDAGNSTDLTVEEVAADYGDAKTFGRLEASKEDKDNYIDYALKHLDRDEKGNKFAGTIDTNKVANALKSNGPVNISSWNADDQAAYNYMQNRIKRVQDIQGKVK